MTRLPTHDLPGQRSARGHASSSIRPRLRLLIPLALLNLLALACGEAVPGSEPLTIAECQDLGGSPLFDPGDERPIEASCPSGLRFLGEFYEPFFGADGGLCCGGAEVEAEDEAELGAE